MNAIYEEETTINKWTKITMLARTKPTMIQRENHARTQRSTALRPLTARQPVSVRKYKYTVWTDINIITRTLSETWILGTKAAAKRQGRVRSTIKHRWTTTRAQMSFPGVTIIIDTCIDTETSSKRSVEFKTGSKKNCIMWSRASPQIRRRWHRGVL